MEVDSEPSLKPPTPDMKITNGTSRKASEEPTAGTKGVTFSRAEKPMSSDELYPIFWALQQNFSQPKRLFDPKHLENFANFKSGLEATMAVFKSVQAENSGRPTKLSDESKRGTKRKRGQGDDDLANAFNQTYLTNPDLFELEVGMHYCYGIELHSQLCSAQRPLISKAYIGPSSHYHGLSIVPQRQSKGEVVQSLTA